MTIFIVRLIDNEIFTENKCTLSQKPFSREHDYMMNSIVRYTTHKIFFLLNFMNFHKIFRIKRKLVEFSQKYTCYSCLLN